MKYGTRLPRIAAVLAGGALIVGITAGCASVPGTPSAAAPPAIATSNTPTSAPTTVAAARSGNTRPVANTAPAPTAAPKAAPKVPECSIGAGLAIKVDEEDDAAGQDRANLVFTNNTHAPCVLVGFPGVSFADERGQSFGQPADRQGPIGQQLTLGVGDQASAEISWEDGDHVDESVCNPQQASGFDVYPPDSYTDNTVTFHGLDQNNAEDECSTGQYLHVWSIVPGDSQAGWH